MNKVGDIYHSFYLDDEDMSVTWWEHHVRTIRAGKVTAIVKNPVTWGKRSKKHGDFGWLKNIPQLYRESWSIREKPYDLYKTKLMAINAEIQKQKKRDWYYPEDYKNYMKKLLQIKGRIRR